MGLPGGDLVLLAATIAITLSKDLSTEDISLLGVLFTAIGDNLSVIAVKRGILESANE